ncbi:MAG: tRNA1(Val) (adenine(37)-N6)-methyltransferase [Clostridia bacterium]|nr:tRNA1(Val) (adenine(37)-N6)-methyltransferase [Clostridia bacterium]
MQNNLKENERIEDIQFNNLKLIQNPNWFCYGIDAVLIAKFCDVKKGWCGVDLGTGTGIIPLLLSAKNMREIIGIEIQDEVADMAKRSVEINGLEDRIKILNIDMNKACQYIKPYSMDMVISNPPYMAKNEGLINDEDIKAISRHEIKASLENVISTANDLLKDRGHFYLVHRPHRLVDILYLCRKYRLEPKRIRFVHPQKNKKPNILLLHCTKYGKPELKFLDPLYVYKEDGTYTDEIYQIYERENEN